MERRYHTIEKKDTQALVRFWTKNGQALLPMVELIEQSKLAVDELIDVLGRASIEAVLQLSAQGMAGPRHPGKKGGPLAGTDARRARCVCGSASCGSAGRSCARNSKGRTVRWAFQPAKLYKRMGRSAGGCWRSCLNPKFCKLARNRLLGTRGKTLWDDYEANGRVEVRV